MMQLTPEQMIWHSTLMALLEYSDLESTKALAFCDAAADAFSARFPQASEPNHAAAQALAFDGPLSPNGYPLWGRQHAVNDPIVNQLTNAVQNQNEAQP